VSDLLQPTACAVTCHGELVGLSFGNVSATLEFQVALQIAAAMRHEARFAKATAGFAQWRTIRSVGVLHDASAKKPKRKRFMEKLPGMLHVRDISVCAIGQVVSLRLGRSTIGIPWETALQVSQWIRVRGKEAKRNASEQAHWSTFTPPAFVHCVDASH